MERLLYALAAVAIISFFVAFMILCLFFIAKALTVSPLLGVLCLVFSIFLGVFLFALSMMHQMSERRSSVRINYQQKMVEF